LTANYLRLALDRVLDRDATDAIGAYKSDAKASGIEDVRFKDLSIAIRDTEEQIQRLVVHVRGGTLGISKGRRNRVVRTGGKEGTLETKKAVLLGWGEDAAPPHCGGYGSLGRDSVPYGKINREPSKPGTWTS
jgi:hypothetical protein